MSKRSPPRVVHIHVNKKTAVLLGVTTISAWISFAITWGACT